LAVLSLIFFLLRRRVFIGTVMAAGSLVLALLYVTPPALFLHGVYLALFSPRALEMTSMLVCTMIMENIMRRTGTMREMVTSVAGIFPDRRFVMAAMPATIGLLPSVGGAVFSAPMVAEAAEGMELRGEQKAFINYWYRHIWEYVSPLYPGIILVSGMTGRSFRDLAVAHAPYAVAVVLVGVFFCFRGMHPDRAVSRGEAPLRSAMTFGLSISPIVLALVLVVIVRVNPGLALGGAVLVLLLWHRYTPARIVETLRESVSFKAVFLVAGVLLFQETLEATGALRGVSDFLAGSGLPMLPLIMAIPFLAGMMTGLTVAFVGITFPFLLPLMGEGGVVGPGLLALAFGSGFCGVMLSPLHLCLILSGEYFNADFGAVFRRLPIPSALVLASGFITWYLYS
ncbi:MAG: DUF401 family protein, partial [Sulfuricella sp.]|nr:DUF401 family protein [Sulfuricella sp.]